jgi:outer membrane protein OmpA-like peptidoglycan-associated protein
VLSLLFALVVVGSWWTARGIESDVRIRAAAALREVDPAARLEVDGRDVHLLGLGTAPDPREAATAVAGLDGVRLVTTEDATSLAVPGSPSATAAPPGTGSPVPSPRPSPPAPPSASPENTANPPRGADSPVAPTPPRVTLFFRTGQFRLSQAAFDQLDVVAIYMKAHPESRIVVSGHSDTVGPPAAKVEISLLRAEAVRTYIATRGVAFERIRIRALSDSQPAATNTTEAGRAKNRRVDIDLEDAH